MVSFKKEKNVSAMHMSIFLFFKEMDTLAIRRQCYCSAILTDRKFIVLSSHFVT